MTEQTSIEAYLKVLPRVTGLQGHVLRSIGMRYVTDEELAETYAGPYQSPSGLRTRRSELVKKGLVEKAAGHHRTTKSGCRAAVWRATPDGLRKAHEMREEEDNAKG